MVRIKFSCNGEHLIRQGEDDQVFIKIMKLSQLLIKQLLQDIELEGKARQDFNLSRLVASNAGIYGESGSDLRRAV